ncbi:MAG: hypothetical protein IKQ31_02445 [Clostridia bacterium]|nr:hypothetical protein [Clostridia bacterium]
MSVYRELNSIWQKEWSSISSRASGNGDYTTRKLEFFNAKLEELSVNDPSKFSQYCSDFFSVNNSKRKYWGVLDAAMLGVGVGIIVPAILGAIAITPVFLGAVATVAVAKAITHVKQKRYKIATRVIEILRANTNKIKFFRFFKKDKKDKHFYTFTRAEFLENEDYSKVLHKSQIPAAVEKHFREIGDNLSSFPEWKESVDKKNTKKQAKNTSDDSESTKKAWYNKYFPALSTNEQILDDESIPMYYPKVFSDAEPEMIKRA